MSALQAKRNKQASDKMSEMIARELQASVASNAPVVYKSDAMGYIKGVKK